LDGADLFNLMPDYHAFDFHDLYKEYHNRLKERQRLDFNDLLIKTVELIRTSEETLHELQQRWRYFMIDEYQDTNHAQYLIAKYLASTSRNICVVGDDDQSIYSWRGADIRNILDFEKDYSEASTITLEKNYRSTQQILDAAHSVIKTNINRKEKKLTANREEGEPVLWIQANNEYRRG
jgi:DNA helicase-2/ATP-dependent DNA helicase PcrA